MYPKNQFFLAINFFYAPPPFWPKKIFVTPLLILRPPHPEENDHPLNIRARYWYTKSILNYRARFYILFCYDDPISKNMPWDRVGIVGQRWCSQPQERPWPGIFPAGGTEMGLCTRSTSQRRSMSQKETSQRNITGTYIVWDVPLCPTYYVCPKT